MKEISFDDWKRELNALRKKNEKNILDIFWNVTNINSIWFNKIIRTNTKDEIKVIINEFG
jgi:hypothetical protein